MKIKVRVCFVCLKKIDSFPSSKNDCGDGATDCNDFPRFLKFASSYLKVEVSQRDFGVGGGGGVTNVFCHDCKSLIRSVCNLYKDLLQVQLCLAWKLGDLGKLLESSKWEVSGIWGEVLIKSMVEHLVSGGSGRNDDGGVEIIGNLRSSLIQKCGEKSREMLPNVQVELLRQPTTGCDDDDDNQTYPNDGAEYLVMNDENHEMKMEVDSVGEELDSDCEAKYVPYSPSGLSQFRTSPLQQFGLKKPSESVKDEDQAEDCDERVEEEFEFFPDTEPMNSLPDSNDDDVSEAGQTRTGEENENDILNKICQYCNKSLEGIGDEELQAHLRKHEQTLKGKDVPCYFCFKAFALLQSRDVHVKLRHSKLMKCEIPSCNQTFSCHTVFNQHLKTHMEEQDGKIHLCKLCHLGFTTPSHLELHELLHIPPCRKAGPNHKFRCPKCDTGFPKPDRLQGHFNVKHGQNLKLYKCSKCGVALATLQNLEQHMRQHQRSLNRKPKLYQILNQDKNSPFECQRCQKVLKNWRQYCKHVSNYHKDFSCKTCGEQFTGYLFYYYHTHKEHKQQKKVKQKNGSGTKTNEKIHTPGVIDPSSPA